MKFQLKTAMKLTVYNKLCSKRNVLYNVRRNSSIDERYLQFISSIFSLLEVFYHKIPSVTGTELSARCTVCYRRPE